MPIRRICFSALGVLATVLAVWAVVVEPASLRVREETLSLPGLRPELVHLRVAVIADLHVGSPFNGIAKLHRIVRATNDTKPDLVLLVGDFVTQGVIGGHFVSPEQIAPVLNKLQAPLGVWAVLGNHDWWFDASRVSAALARSGIPVLEDTAVRIPCASSHFWLVGIGDFWEGRHDVEAALRQVTDEAPVIAMTHNPDIFPWLSNRCSLVVAGHTHGGQVWFPFLGRPVVPSIYKQRYAAGHVVEDGRHLFVSTGLGTSVLPVRFLVPPEVTILELQPHGAVG